MIGTAGLRDDRVPKRGVDAGAGEGEGVRSHRVGWMEGTRWAATFAAVGNDKLYNEAGRDKLFGGSGKGHAPRRSAKDKLSRGPGKDSEKQ